MITTLVSYVLYLHIIVGSVALISGGIAISSKKGGTLHRKAGKIYFIAMTLVFITGIFVAGFKMNYFLFLIAFLSYYTVFNGVRILKLKRLHKKQKPKWYDWLAGIINTVANLIFLGYGLYLGTLKGFTSGGALLSMGFGIGGLTLSYTNLMPFIKKPTQGHYWYISHIGNMMGGYIATLTAFLSTIVTRHDVMNPFLAFALPSLIGVPILIYWIQKTDKKFSKA